MKKFILGIVLIVLFTQIVLERTKNEQDRKRIEELEEQLKYAKNKIQETERSLKQAEQHYSLLEEEVATYRIKISKYSRRALIERIKDKQQAHRQIDSLLKLSVL